MKKIIWAVDAFESSGSFYKKTAKIIKSFARGSKFSVTPVYVLSPEQLNLPTEFGSPWLLHYKAPSEKQLRQLLKTTEGLKMSKPVVLMQKQPSLKESTKALISFSKKEGADLLVLSTHGRKGVSRLFLGSFAETVLTRAIELPMLVVNPKTQQTPTIKNVIFATDFSSKSERAIDNVVEHCKRLNAKLTIFNTILRPIEPIIASGVQVFGGVWMPAPEYLDLERKKQEKLALKLAEQIKKKGIKVDVAVEVSAASNASQAILYYAKRSKAQLIALASQSGPMSSALLGSVTRQVIRDANCPIWVVHK